MVLKHADVTSDIIQSMYDVHNKLGYGFQEKVYANSLAIVLRRRGRIVEREAKIVVYFEGNEVGEYFVDLLVDGCVIVECKAAKELLAEHEAQLLNYLKALRVEVGMLVNFGPKASYKRKVYDNANKGDLRWTTKE